jgi:hypothetical protein
MVFALLVFVVLGWCASVDAHTFGAEAGAERCRVQPVSIKAGAERASSVDRMTPALMPSVTDPTIVWHRGIAALPLPAIAIVPLSLRRHASRAPPSR